MRLLSFLLLCTLMHFAPARADTGLQDSTQIMRNCLDDFPKADEKIQKCGAGIIVRFCLSYPLNYTYYQQGMCMMREAAVWQTIYAEALEKLPASKRHQSLQALAHERHETCVPPLKAAKNDLRMPNYYKCLRDVTARKAFQWFKTQESKR